MNNLEIIKGGDIFKSKCDMLICPINLCGTMNVGLAKQFKDRFSGLRKHYIEGLGFIKNPKGVKDYTKIKYLLYMKDRDYSICLFPTQWDFREKADIKLIKMGLERAIFDWQKDCRHAASIAFPKLGCDENGGLNWEKQVKPLLIDFAAKYKYYVEVYE